MSAPADAPVSPRSPSRFSLTPAVGIALLADLVCIVVFVALGKENHGVHRGVGWFFNVWWPLAGGLVVGALITRLYTATDRWPLRLVVTIAITVLVGGPLRTVTGRVMYSVFTLVAFGMLNLLTFGWRLMRVAVRQMRGTPVTAR
ncbi:MAG: DUF3054 domain-containing protein [Acidimicrobiia bacterium]